MSFLLCLSHGHPANPPAMSLHPLRRSLPPPVLPMSVCPSTPTYPPSAIACPPLPAMFSHNPLFLWQHLYGTQQMEVIFKLHSVCTLSFSLLHTLTNIHTHVHIDTYIPVQTCSIVSRGTGCKYSIQ